MPSTVYKGDIAEISFGTEAGMKIVVGTGLLVVELY